MKILAIETSCDETSAAVLEKTNDEIKVLSNVTATSILIHAKTGGIIPENAARMQVTYIIPVIVEALLTAGDADPKPWIRASEFLKNEIDVIAVTYGPGLIGSLLVGVETAKTLSFVFEKPLIPINHLLAHIYANFISSQSKPYPLNPIPFPFVGLIVSGGHTDLLYFETHNKYKWLGGTRDDAAGEAFDKIGRLLNLSYPAGPEIERRANLSLPLSLKERAGVRFQSPMIYSKNFDFSFSGLKAEALRFVQQKSVILKEAKRPIGSTLHDSIATLQNDKNSMINEICFATQKAILDVLVKKTLDAAEKYNCKTILVGGGVSANQTLKNQFVSEIRRYEIASTLGVKNQESRIDILFPDKEYSTDNAAMIGAYALMNFKPVNWQKVNANPELYFA